MRDFLQRLNMGCCVGLALLTLGGCHGSISAGNEKDLEQTAPKNTRVPIGFPVPIYAGADVIEVVDVPMTKGQPHGTDVRLESTDPVKKIDSYYAYTLTKTGWAVREMSLETYGLANTKTILATNENHQITLNIIEDRGKSLITISTSPVFSATDLQKK